MAPNQPTRRKIIGTPKERLGQRGIKHSNGWAQSPPVLQAGLRFQIVCFREVILVGCKSSDASWTMKFSAAAEFTDRQAAGNVFFAGGKTSTAGSL
jgi:hypothetical protein